MMLLGSSSSSSTTSTTTAALPVLAALLVGFMGSLPQPVEGHAYLMEPVSRNFWATDAFQDPSYPDINWCPHCFQSRGPAAVRARAEEHTDPEELELYGGGAWPHYSAYQRNELASNGNYYEPDAIAVRHGICGDPEQTAEEGSNLFGKDNSNYPILQTYAEGSVMEVKVAISTNHWGHLEFFICNADDMTDPDGVVTQGCFNMHPLDRASDDDSASRIDPNHVGRYFLDPTCRASETDQTMPPGAFAGDVATGRYQLPDGLTCTRCILQMVYYTGNSCKHPGYDEFDPPSWDSECAPNTADWINTGVAMCGDGDAYPEEFWNCADIEITSDGESAPTPSTTSSESEPTAAPDSEDSEEAAPTYVPTPAPDASEDSEEDAAPTYVPTPAPDSSEDSEEAAPTYEPSMSPDDSGEDSGDTAPTPAPIMYEGYTSMPVQSDDSSDDDQQPSSSDEPRTLTMAPATFAPSVPGPAPEGGDCDDPVGAYAQCGGDDYDGSTCCRAGYECEDVADCYSECRPVGDACVEGWGQCGGSDWDGPTCCKSGGVCLERSESFFQCVPELPQLSG